MSLLGAEWIAVEKIITDSARAAGVARADNDPVMAELARELEAAAGRRAWASGCCTHEHLRNG